MAERSGVSRELGEALLQQQEQLFERWHRVRDGTLSRSQLILEVVPIRQLLQELLTEGASYPIAKGEKTPLAKTVRTCQQLLKVEPALWLFVTVEGLEPTNNAAEQAIRPAVLWRRCSYGSQSAEGSLFVGRIDDRGDEPSTAEAKYVGLSNRSLSGKATGSTGPLFLATIQPC
jgi:transposase